MAEMIRAVIMAAVSVVMVPMMVAAGVRIIRQSPGSERLCRFISLPLHTGVKLDPRVSQRHLRAHTYTAADQGVYFGRL